MSFLKRLFGGSTSDPTPKIQKPFAEEFHEGFQIAALPANEGGQYRLCGTISKEIDGELKTHRLIRADIFGSAEECAKFTISKAKQVIKEQGDRLFM